MTIGTQMLRTQRDVLVKAMGPELFDLRFGPKMPKSKLLAEAASLEAEYVRKLEDESKRIHAAYLMNA